MAEPKATPKDKKPPKEEKPEDLNIKRMELTPTQLPDFQPGDPGLITDFDGKKLVMTPSQVSQRLDIDMNDSVGAGGAFIKRAITMTSGDATPSVKNANILTTAGTTAITDFDDGVIGQILYVKAATSITITHGSPIQLAGAANFAMVDGDVLLLGMFTDQVWYEVARATVTVATAVVRRYFQAVVFAPTNPVSTGNGKFYIHVPAEMDAMDLVEVHAEVVTAGTTNTTDIQINNVTQAADMLSTKLTIDSGETGSDTAATPAVIDTANDDVAENDLLRIDVDAIQATAPIGLIVTLGFE